MKNEDADRRNAGNRRVTTEDTRCRRKERKEEMGRGRLDMEKEHAMRAYRWCSVGARSSESLRCWLI
jgi:hypothetical protein